jgi:hypothetical protein
MGVTSLISDGSGGGGTCERALTTPNGDKIASTACERAWKRCECSASACTLPSVSFAASNQDLHAAHGTVDDASRDELVIT